MKRCGALRGRNELEKSYSLSNLWNRSWGNTWAEHSLNNPTSFAFLISNGCGAIKDSNRQYLLKMLIFTSVNGRNCREKAGPSKCGRSELWDFNGDSSHDDIRDENENYDETVIDDENIDQTSREYFFLRRHAQHLIKSFKFDVPTVKIVTYLHAFKYFTILHSPRLLERVEHKLFIFCIVLMILFATLGTVISEHLPRAKRANMRIDVHIDSRANVLYIIVKIPLQSSRKNPGLTLQCSNKKPFLKGLSLRSRAIFRDPCSTLTCFFILCYCVKIDDILIMNSILCRFIPYFAWPQTRVREMQDAPVRWG